ncbi:MAG TPA: HNH endonuclease [Roseateles sp.]
MNSLQKRFVRFSLHAGAGGRCTYCGVGTGLRRGTIDHYLPLALGGTDERGNLRWCCVDCNAAKGALHPNEWERMRPKRASKSRHEARCELITAAIQRQRRAHTLIVHAVPLPRIAPGLKPRAVRMTVTGDPGRYFAVGGQQFEVVARSWKP